MTQCRRQGVHIRRLNPLLDATVELAKDEAIDPVAELAGYKVYLFQITFLLDP